MKAANNLKIRRVTAGDKNLAEIAKQVAWVKWGELDYTAESLTEFVASPDRLYLIGEIEDQVVGVIHGYLLPHPDGHKVFYIDEVDTKDGFRRQGIATLMMKETLKLAGQLGATEAWLGTEHDNEPAKALYQKLGPSEVENGPIYTYKVK